MTLATVPRYDPESVEEKAGHAIVVGGSMAGMLSARVLADRYATVTVLDRDPLVDEPVSRTGVPQSSQPHGLLERPADSPSRAVVVFGEGCHGVPGGTSASLLG